jgi:hypothetical protein
MEVLPERMSVKHEQLNDAGKEKEDVESRINLQPAPDEESLQTNNMAFLVLAEEQTGNQKTAEDEEEIHAGPSDTSKERPNARVMEEHGDNRYTAEDIQPFVSHLLILVCGPKAKSRRQRE